MGLFAAAQPVRALVNGCTEFGIDNTGAVSDNSAALTTALNATAQYGVGVFIPNPSANTPAIVNVTNPFTMGNGNQSSGVSSVQGGALVGAGYTSAQFVQANSAFSHGLCTINWLGPDNDAYVCGILGPLWGWRLENLYFTSPISGGAANPIWNKGGCGGLMRNVSIDLFNGSGLIDDVSPSSADLDALFNEFDHIYINIPAGQVGLTLGPSSLSSQNCCFEWFHDMWVAKPASPALATYGILDDGSDTCRFDRIYSGCVGANSYGYRVHVGGSGYTPGGHVFDRCDFNSQSSGVSVSVTGGSVGANGPITFRNFGTANGLSINPHLAGIIWQCPESPAGTISGATPVYGTAFTNNYGVPITIYPTGGTTTAVEIASTTGFPVAGPWRLGVGVSITLTGTGTFACNTVGD